MSKKAVRAMGSAKFGMRGCFRRSVSFEQGCRFAYSCPRTYSLPTWASACQGANSMWKFGKICRIGFLLEGDPKQIAPQTLHECRLISGQRSKQSTKEKRMAKGGVISRAVLLNNPRYISSLPYRVLVLRGSIRSSMKTSYKNSVGQVLQKNVEAPAM